MATRLGLNGGPGRGYTFSAKTPAASTVRTALSVTATPGRPERFTAKGSASSAVKGAGQFTALGPMGLPGRRHGFTVKEQQAQPIEPVYNIAQSRQIYIFVV